MKIAIATAGVALVLGAAACNTNPSSMHSAGTQPAAHSSPATAAPPTTTPPATVGTTLHTGSVYITLTKLIDPAQGADSYTTPNAGDRFVGTEFMIANRGTKILSDDINSDVSVQGSNGQTYSPDFNSIAGCTNFNAGMFTITPNQVQSGCATFQIPTGVSVTQVQFQLTQGLNTSVGQWKVG